MTDIKNSNDIYLFGIDIGGTTCKMGLFTHSGKLLDKWEIPTDKSNGGLNVFADLAKAVDSKLKELGIDKALVAGIGAGVPGAITAKGDILNCPNLGWSALNVPEKLSAASGLPVKAGNDANLAALGEVWQGASKGFDNMMMVTLGTGVGGGIVCEGRILTGAHGCCGELGHMKVNYHETRNCGCGGKGCLEQYASATGIANMAKEALAGFDGETTLRNFDVVTAKEVFDGAKAGDVLSLQIVEKFGRILGRALATACVVFDPDCIVIGGGVSRAGSILTDVVEKYYREFAFSPCRDTRFAIATLGNDAGIYGSAKLALDEFV